MFKMRLEGLEEFVEYLGMMRERASKVQEAIEGGGDAKQVKASLGQMRESPHRSPLMEQADAQEVASGKVKENDMYEAYWTAEDIIRYLTED